METGSEVYMSELLVCLLHFYNNLIGWFRYGGL